NALKSALHEQNVSLATEKEFSNKFPDCEVGAMPPFGNLYNMDVYVDKALTTNKEIAFNAGTHNEIMKISCQDYVSLVKPKIINLMH
ncbi:MAG: YbaK/EbsC family protein, partial [Proteobacteria bacterium]|nr:YbaK/EbsC family protein [Pseudomonadota bacterium]